LSGAVAQRYAAALADVALEQKITDKAKADLAAFESAFYAAPDLRNFLESPAIGENAKQNAIGQIATKMELSAAVGNFIRLILRHRRTEMLAEIQVAFRQELNARLGIAEAEVTSAQSLNDQQKNELTRALEKRTGKKIEARFREDKNLLGGAVVRVGSTVYDGSVREQLARLRQQLEAE
jgi:F-type H+-transporting ATPase subunit delta